MRITKEVNINLIDIDRMPFDLKLLEYANEVLKGVIFPPIKLQRIKNGRFKIKDGRHRFLAHRINRKQTILEKYSLKYETIV